MLMPSTRPPSSSLAVIAEQHGISQNEIMRRTGLAYQTINDAWHGRSRTTIDTWIKIAKAIPVPLAMIAPRAADELDDLVIR